MIRVGELTLDLEDPFILAALGAGAALALLLLLLALAVRRAGRAAASSAALAQRVEALGHAQSQLVGAQAQSVQAMETRLSDLSSRLGESLTGSATRTARSLGELQQRLGLQDILSNKQTRGAFGEIQLRDILTKALPADVVRWQATLSNGKRADCVVDLPDPPGPLVIDAKFPLEAYEALRAAETDAQKKAAVRDFRSAVRGHVKAIAERYLLPGETADGALMFLPSEAVYAELHANFGDVVREGFTARVWIVSPTTCMAVLNTLRGVLKDARMREQAGAIRATLKLLHRDVEQVGERVEKLHTHFRQAQADLDGIETAAQRAGKRAAKLETFEFEDPAPVPAPASRIDIVRR